VRPKPLSTRTREGEPQHPVAGRRQPVDNERYTGASAPSTGGGSSSAAWRE
jgi:hypothetical protein